MGAVSVSNGELSLAQTGALTAASYTTASNAVTTIGGDAQLAVAGTFTQAADATLNTTIGTTNLPIITADTAALDGTLNVTGFSGTVATTASSLLASEVTLIQTTNGITGDFSSVNLGGGSSAVDYVTLAGGKSTDNLQYNVGFGLTWLAGPTAGNGVFTLANTSDTFNVDIALGDQTGPFTSGWSGNKLTKAGDGTLILSAANTYTGETAVNGGTLRTGIANAFAQSSAVTLAAGTTLDLNGFNQTAKQLSGAGNVTLGSGALTADIAAAANLSGLISGTGSVTKTGTGDWTLSGNNSYTGGTTISAGKVIASNGNALGTGAIDNAAALELAFDTDETLANVLSGAGSLAKTGTGTGTLTGTGSSVGAVSVSNGELSLAQTGALTAASYTTASNAVTTIGGDAQLAVAGAFTQAADATLNTTIGTTNLPIITADTAALDGTLNVTGFSGTVATTASSLLASEVTLIQTTNGITGDFSSVNLGGGSSAVDYVTLAGGKSTDNLQYNVGFGLTWLAGPTAGNGVFTLANTSDTFNVDIALGDQTGPFTSGWSGNKLTKAGDGTLILSAANTYTGETAVNGGVLIQGAIGSLSGASTYSIAQAAQIALGGYATSMAALSNAGTVDFGGAGGTILNVTGNYIGDGGTLVLNTVLGDDSSKTDRLQVGGDTSGSTTVKVINHGGVGAQTTEGIKIIAVDGQSNGTFSLAGDYTTKDGQQAVVAGAYAYTLHEGGVSTPSDGDWYLRSELKDGKGPVINPGIPLYQGAVQAMQALNKLPTLQQRVGNRYWNSAANPVIEQGADAIATPLVSSEEAGTATDSQAIWGRIEAAHNRLEPDTSGSRMKQDIDTFIMQAGVDGQFYEGESGKLIGGITSQYGKAYSGISSAESDGKVDTQGWGLGATLTWYGDNGFYVDGQAQANWYDNDFDSTTANRSPANGRKGFGYALSVETGQRVDLNEHWSLTPQAQLMWSSVDFDSFNDVWGTAVALRDGDSLTGRIALSADYRNAWWDTDGQIVRTSIYGIANLYQELMGDMSVKVAGVNFGTDNDRTWGGIGAGGTYAWADDRYAIYGEGSLNTSLNHFADSYTVKGTVGFRAKW
ncbi:autotransporter outer membrane beta-barrel domain-containing protein [Brucella inopinata]|uniref:Autotransporter outer membrane beta-barrel domain-containing protein n=1 Tax=Brucella inopinata TaxID=1218315 RepID=A0AAW7BBH0_9HYPH|nr:autotransporter outer membrane beta-barrel domain-containing protein [Brucella inopinata]MDL2331868.1 autotransporter outer membrane beta-barrel domain-containing protein [Brucella inopinata]